ncbi:hypothetical protein [Paenibacillus sp. MBLB4367]|uniref:DUF7408 domain-containing protein n=1 Tax=Paenibacillus sp. MBLB4367 TaxID=3384767 RepID=UPI0039083D70
MVRTNVRRAWLFCIAVCLLIAAGGFSFALPASAEEDKLSLQIDPAVNGQAKGDKWFPVQFTITNQGSDVSGELAVTFPSMSGGKDVTYSVPVDMPKQTTKTVTMALPGMNFNKNNNKVVFYKGKAADGKPVGFAGGSAYIETAPLPFGTVQVGVIARDPDTMSFLGLLNQKGYQVKTVPLKMENIPAESMLLDSMDMLVFNDAASDQLKEDQVKAIEGWVKRGGMLVLAGGAGYPKTAAPFGSISPVAYSGTESVKELNALSKAAGKELTLAEPFTVSRAELKGGRAVISEGLLPLFASKSLGAGQVWYAAYDLALNPLASWNGNTAVWETILSGYMKSSGMNKFNNNWFWEINNELENFKAFKLPSFGILLLVIILYAIVVGPLMYAVLRKMDKREWAWLTIPLAAVVFTAGIYVVGASGRSSTMSQAFSTVTLDGSGEGAKTSFSSVFVPRGGEFRLDIPVSSYVTPMIDINYRSSGGNGLRGTTDMFVTKAPGSTNVTFSDVSYWSIRKASIEFDKPEPFGMLETKVKVTASGIDGTVTNRTNTDLTGVSLYAGGQIYALKDLKAGETAIAQSPTTSGTAFVSSNLYDLANVLLPYQGGPRDDNRQKRALLSTYVQKMQDRDLSAFVIGWSEKSDGNLYTVEGKAVQTDELTLWAQSIDVELVSGSSVFVPGSNLKPQVVSSTASQTNDPYGNVTAGMGEIVLEYKLPGIPGAAFGKMSKLNNLDKGGQITYEIWNAAKQTWESFDYAKLTQEGALAEFVEGGQSIKLKINLKQREVQMRYPEFAVEGTVKP